MIISIIICRSTSYPLTLDFIKSLYIENDEKIDNISGVNNTDKLIELGKLYKDGLLTREEFEEQKNLL